MLKHSLEMLFCIYQVQLAIENSFLLASETNFSFKIFAYFQED